MCRHGAHRRDFWKNVQDRNTSPCVCSNAAKKKEERICFIVLRDLFGSSEKVDKGKEKMSLSNNKDVKQDKEEE